MNMAAITLTSTNFKEEAIDSPLPVLIDFWASWCGPCRMVSPIVEELSDELDGVVKVGKVNVDEEGGIASEYGVMSIPTIILIKDGKVSATSIGARPKEDIRQQLGI
jgi:thioredoxin 1